MSRQYEKGFTDPLNPQSNPSTTDIDGDSIVEYIDMNNEKKIAYNLVTGYYATSTGNFSTGTNWYSFKIQPKH